MDMAVTVLGCGCRVAGTAIKAIKPIKSIKSVKAIKATGIIKDIKATESIKEVSRARWDQYSTAVPPSILSPVVLCWNGDLTQKVTQKASFTRADVQNKDRRSTQNKKSVMINPPPTPPDNQPPINTTSKNKYDGVRRACLGDALHHCKETHYHLPGLSLTLARGGGGGLRAVRTVLGRRHHVFLW